MLSRSARGSAPFRSNRPTRAAGCWRVSVALAVAAAVGGILWSRRSVQTTRLPRSIAVLPFKPLVEQAPDQAMELGIAETLINRLSSLPDVTVTPLSSVRRYAGSEQDPLAAGRDLDVAAVIEGHVQFQPDRVRLTARLLDVRDRRRVVDWQLRREARRLFRAAGFARTSARRRVVGRPL